MDVVTHGFIVRISCLLTFLANARPITAVRTKAMYSMFDWLRG